MQQKGIKRGDFGLGILPPNAVNDFHLDLATTKEEFESLLKKASQQKPKPSPKSSKR